MTTSVWETYDRPQFSQAKEDERVGAIEAQICVVGTGIGGMTAAYQLAHAGKKIVVVGDGNFASGESSKTTAQINTIHDDTWVDMEAIHGQEGIQICAEGYKRAIGFIREIVKNENIDCYLEKISSYIFPSDADGRNGLRKEFSLAENLGFDVELIDSLPGIDLPGPILAYHDQAQFHPLMYLSAIAEILSAMPNVQIFTGTRVIDVNEVEHEVRLICDNGSVIIADSVILATNVPIHRRFIPHDALAPYRSYVIGIPVLKDSIPYAQYSDTEDPYHYVRLVSNNRLEYELDSKFDCLLVGGEDHRVAEVDDSDKRFARLFTWARNLFPLIQELSFKWSAQTIETFDGMPMLGRSPHSSKNIFIITGDSGTGMTHATLGGIITSDLILNREDKGMAEFFSPARMRTKSMKRWISENSSSISQYRDWLTPGEVTKEEEIKPGTGAIIRDGLSKHAIYRAVDGNCTRLCAVCPHLKAIVRWNPVEDTWDCPAHGSRFTKEGKIINGPATCGLEPVDIANLD